MERLPDVLFLDSQNSPRHGEQEDESVVLEIVRDENITVLDISKRAIERAKLRIGKRSEQVKWIEADASNFDPTETYDLWHDRAAFHFLTDEEEIRRYLTSVKKGVKKSGNLIIGPCS